MPDRLLKDNDNQIFEPHHDRTNKMTCAPSEDSDQPGHLPSLIRVFTVHMKKALVLSYPLSTQRRLWSDWADAQADLRLHWVHRSFCWFVMRRLISVCVSFIWYHDPLIEQGEFISTTSWENLFMPYANNKDADQPAHPRGLIGVFVFRCLDSIISLQSTF